MDNSKNIERNDRLPSEAVENHSRNFASFLYVYPVISRRSRGLSIGINLNPDKLCNFDCIYCEVDRITPPRIKYVDLNRVAEELRAVIALFKNGRLSLAERFGNVELNEIKDIAFSGDGEPTMVDNFDKCVEVVARIRKEEQLHNTKIVLITNAAGLDKSSVKRGLELMDANNGEIWGKLDAGTEQYYKLVNRTTIAFERILKNLLETARVRPIVIQSLFLKVHGEIMPAAELIQYCNRLNELVKNGGKIKEVHAYTVARPTPEPYATKLSADELHSIAEVIRNRTGLVVHEFE